MTRSFNSRIDCPTCRCQMTVETAFERWVRDNDDLDSGSGIVRFDLDMLIHKYMFDDRRDLQAMMFVEVKTFGAEVSKSQADTLGAFRQIMNGDRWIHSQMTNEDSFLCLFGGFVLTFEKTCPDDSSWIRWHGRQITAAQLVRILSFELDPNDPDAELDIWERYPLGVSIA